MLLSPPPPAPAPAPPGPAGVGAQPTEGCAGASTPPRAYTHISNLMVQEILAANNNSCHASYIPNAHLYQGTSEL